MNNHVIPPRRSTLDTAVLLVVVVAAAVAYFSVPVSGKGMAGAPSPSDPWTNAQTVTTEDLAKELAHAKGNDRPVIVNAGFRVLYEGAHIPGAVFHGPASKPKGLDDLKKWAEGIPRTANLVVYCGCCPFTVCPNIRPAFEALRAMGFQHLRVLVLPNSFAKDWVAHEYPIEKAM